MPSAKVGKNLPKRCGRDGHKAGFKRYINNDSRAKNKARRVVRAALSSRDPVKVATQQANQSPLQPNSQGVSFFVRKLLTQKGFKLAF